ncbi:MAG TPA: hypothetical protein VGL93_11640 [Streptosporangiaceae bacterium]|jgi:hypothetical protein
MGHPLAAVNIGNSVQSAMDAFGRTVPKIIVFLVILVVGWIVAKALQKLVQVVLDKVRFERVADRGMVGDALRRSNYTATGLVAKIVYWAILLVTLQMAFGVFGPNPISDLLHGVVAWLPKAIVAILLIVIASAIGKAVKDLISAALSGTSYGKVIANIAAIFIVALGVIAAVNQIGIAVTVTMPVLITALATIGGILVVGVGGGAIRPMQQRWDRWLSTVERETAGRGRGTSAFDRGREDAARGGDVPTEAPAGQEASTERDSRA